AGVNGQEEMGAAVGRCRISVKRTNLAADCAVRQATAQEIDDEGQAKSFRAGCRQQHAFDRRGGVGRGPPLRIEGPILGKALPRRGGQTDLAPGGGAPTPVPLPPKNPRGGEGGGGEAGFTPGLTAPPPAAASADAYSKAQCPRSSAPPSCARSVRRCRNESRCAPRPRPARSPAPAPPRA